MAEAADAAANDNRDKATNALPGDLILYFCERTSENDDTSAFTISARSPEEAAQLCWQFHSGKPIAGNENAWRKDDIWVGEITPRSSPGIHDLREHGRGGGMIPRIVNSTPI